jgi:hypothetical protein
VLKFSPAALVFAGVLWVMLVVPNGWATDSQKPAIDPVTVFKKGWIRIEMIPAGSTKGKVSYINKAQGKKCTFMDTPEGRMIRYVCAAQQEVTEYNAKYNVIAIGTMRANEPARRPERSDSVSRRARRETTALRNRELSS